MGLNFFAFQSKIRKDIKLWNTGAQSICTHKSCFENMGQFVTLKKMVQNMCSKKQGPKNQGHCYSKREKEARLLLLFFSNNDPAFCNPYFESFSSKFQTLKNYQADLIN